ncbi:MAG: hypothetical protein LC135_12840 [Phycisphaerae bacterium]|nr:hypothetical protein [Phycisphaerae bacterium]MCZ2400738.1 hypothetical protein [Phycisphaerae bacterium]
MAHAAQTVEPAAVVGTSPTAATPAAAPVPALERRRTSESGKRARALLRSKPDLRAAFVLSEVLAPPVALRENHLL